MNCVIAFAIVLVSQVVMHLIFPNSPVSRMDIVFGAFSGLLLIFVLNRKR